MKINDALSTLEDSATLRINQRVKHDRAQGETVFHFGFGQAAFPVPHALVDHLRQHAPVKDYLPGLGLPALRAAVADFYQKRFGYDVNEGSIAIGPGSKELIYQALLLLEGDLILPSASWVSYKPQAELAGKQVHIVPTTFENDYKLTAQSLSSLCANLGTKQTILILNSPNNPTGTQYSEQEVIEICDASRQHNVVIISDEIYALVNFENDYHSFFTHYPEGTIVTGGLSKAFSAGGWRLGTLLAHPSQQPFMQALSAVISEISSCTSAPIQYAAIKAYEPSIAIDRYLQLTTEIYRAAANYMWKRFQAMNVPCPQPQGAFYLFPCYDAYRPEIANRHGIQTSSEFTELVYTHAKVAMLPGSDFSYPDESWCTRVAFTDFDGEPALQAAESSAEAVDDAFIRAHCPRIVHGLDALEAFLTAYQ